MKTVKVHGVWMVCAVREFDADAISFSAAQSRTRDAPVVCPSRIFDAGDDFDILVDGDDLVLPESLPIQGCGRLAIIEIGQDLCGVEAVLLVVDFSHCARHGLVAVSCVARHCICVCRMTLWIRHGLRERSCSSRPGKYQATDFHEIAS